MSAFIKLFWKPLAIIAVALLFLWWFRHYGDARYEQGRRSVIAEDTKLADAQAVKSAQKERDDAKRIADAYKARDESEAQLAVIRSVLPTRVVCHRTESRPSVLPERAGLSQPEAAGGGALPEAARPSPEPTFDPTETLYAIADGADDENNACRMLNMAVHGMPSAP